ncbi:MAG: AAA family ATPase, partial [Alphaproteobacteria bacterium]|nr:AAA family ATPase [Alphaproteobacteria bacterium]
MDRALAVENASTKAAADALRAEARTAKAAVALGPPGSGKTTAIFASIERALDLGGRVLFALPTAQLASRMRQRFGDRLDIDTCHAAFGLHEPVELGEAGILGLYTLIVVDELSQLKRNNFEKILRLWARADRVPALALLGDRWQMAGVGEERPWESRLWNTMCWRVELHFMFRSKDPVHQKLLRQLRTAQPNAATLKMLLKKMAWKPPGPPTVDGLRKLLKSKPDTTVVTCSRRGAAEINEIALQALFPRGRPLAVLPADVDSNPANYERGALRAIVDLQPSQLPIYRGARLFLTKNVRKDVDYVNGMAAEVLRVLHALQRIPLRAEPGQQHAGSPGAHPQDG